MRGEVQSATEKKKKKRAKTVSGKTERCLQSVASWQRGTPSWKEQMHRQSRKRKMPKEGARENMEERNSRIEKTPCTPTKNGEPGRWGGFSDLTTL